MIIQEIKTPEGEVIAELDLPEVPAEMRLNQYIDIMCAIRKINEGGPDLNAIQVMAEAISDFAGLSLEDVFEVQMGDMYKKDEDLHESLSSVFAYLSRVCLKFKTAGSLRNEGNFTFDVEGELFELPFVKMVALTGGVIMPKVSVRQAVECLEIIRTTEIAMEKGDPEGNLWYSQYLRMIAVLTYKAGGERLPVDEAARQEHYRERIKFFGNRLNLQVALDVDFFLQSTLSALRKNHPIGGSLINPLFALGLITSRQNRRPTKRRKNSMKKFLAA